MYLISIAFFPKLKKINVKTLDNNLILGSLNGSVNSGLCNKCGDVSSLDSARALAEATRTKEAPTWRPRQKPAEEPIYQGINEVKKNDEVDKLKVRFKIIQI